MEYARLSGCRLFPIWKQENHLAFGITEGQVIIEIH